MECEILFLGFGPFTHAFAKKLIAKGHKVVAVSKSPFASRARDEFPPDLFNTISWEEVVSLEVNSISTYIGWRQSPHCQPLGTELINWVKSTNFKTEKIHHLSSASVYTGNQEFFSEFDYNSATNNPLLNSKQALEKLVVDLCREKESKFVNYRISNIYGSGLTRGFINESINNLRNGVPVKIYKNFDLIRDYLLLDDLIAALIDLRLHGSPHKTLNISTGYGVATSQIITHLKNLGVDDLKFLEIEVPEKTMPRSVLSCKKLEEIISWKPQGIGESLNRLMQESFQVREGLYYF